MMWTARVAPVFLGGAEVSVGRNRKDSGLRINPQPPFCRNFPWMSLVPKEGYSLQMETMDTPQSHA
jgi:hypothetical protein